jgi:DNA-binding transcriptional MerR regulator
VIGANDDVECTDAGRRRRGGRREVQDPRNLAASCGAPAVEGDETPTIEAEGFGYRGVTACHAVSISYRQLDYWARTGLVVPSIRDASGSGTQRLYSFRDMVVLKVVKRLLDAGVSLQNIRKAIDVLRSRGADDLAQITLISDGTTVYECRSPEEVVDLLQGGQGVFGIAISGAFKEIQGSLAQLPAEPVAELPDESDSIRGPSASDELAARRARRRAG